ncbi:hypothetical protein BLNAU_11765 [Blattamonas nauphoetae]|uniref:C2HC/C3H-type domain-containing protein n=1 Tax=Blattamonas nauphoetae TaxID=2049346 RepID=A0ABQ9XLJ7_9EUKA|nr:hypothetical protein BLNAU_11765 [Blattamonas nauphoetae]
MFPREDSSYSSRNSPDFAEPDRDYDQSEQRTQSVTLRRQKRYDITKFDEYRQTRENAQDFAQNLEKIGEATLSLTHPDPHQAALALSFLVDATEIQSGTITMKLLESNLINLLYPFLSDFSNNTLQLNSLKILYNIASRMTASEAEQVSFSLGAQLFPTLLTSQNTEIVDEVLNLISELCHRSDVLPSHFLSQGFVDHILRILASPSLHPSTIMALTHAIRGLSIGEDRPRLREQWERIQRNEPAFVENEVFSELIKLNQAISPLILLLNDASPRLQAKILRCLSSLMRRNAPAIIVIATPSNIHFFLTLYQSETTPDVQTNVLRAFASISILSEAHTQLLLDADILSIISSHISSEMDPEQSTHIIILCNNITVGSTSQQELLAQSGIVQFYLTQTPTLDRYSQKELSLLLLSIVLDSPIVYSALDMHALVASLLILLKGRADTQEFALEALLELVQQGLSEISDIPMTEGNQPENPIEEKIRDLDGIEVIEHLTQSTTDALLLADGIKWGGFRPKIISFGSMLSELLDSSSNTESDPYERAYSPMYPPQKVNKPRYPAISTQPQQRSPPRSRNDISPELDAEESFIDYIAESQLPHTPTFHSTGSYNHSDSYEPNSLQMSNRTPVRTSVFLEESSFRFSHPEPTERHYTTRETYSDDEHANHLDSPVELQPCPYCGRSFAVDRLPKHKEICKRAQEAEKNRLSRLDEKRKNQEKEEEYRRKSEIHQQKLREEQSQEQKRKISPKSAKIRQQNDSGVPFLSLCRTSVGSGLSDKKESSYRYSQTRYSTDEESDERENNSGSLALSPHKPQNPLHIHSKSRHRPRRMVAGSTASNRLSQNKQVHQQTSDDDHDALVSIESETEPPKEKKAPTATQSRPEIPKLRLPISPQSNQSDFNSEQSVHTARTSLSLSASPTPFRRCPACNHQLCCPSPKFCCECGADLRSVDLGERGGREEGRSERMVEDEDEEEQRKKDESEKQDREREQKEEKEKQRKEDEERLKKEEEDRIAREQADEDRKQKEEARIAEEKAEEERRAKEQEEKQKEEEERIAKEKEDEERKQKEEEERITKEKAEEEERLQKEEDERMRIEDEERRRREEEEKQKKEEEERRQKEEEERLTKEKAEEERKQKEEEERVAPEKTEEDEKQKAEAQLAKDTAEKEEQLKEEEEKDEKKGEDGSIPNTDAEAFPSRTPTETDDAVLIDEAETT